MIIPLKHLYPVNGKGQPGSVKMKSSVNRILSPDLKVISPFPSQAQMTMSFVRNMKSSQTVRREVDAVELSSKGPVMNAGLLGLDGHFISQSLHLVH